MSLKVYRIINLFRRTFNPNIPTSNKRQLYMALILLYLLYCSPVWRPNLIKFLEKIQRATKYICTVNYKERLISLSLLPLMYQFELNDILLFISCLKNPNHNFTLMDHLTFNSTSTRSSTFSKLNQHSNQMKAMRTSLNTSRDNSKPYFCGGPLEEGHTITYMVEPHQSLVVLVIL